MLEPPHGFEPALRLSARRIRAGILESAASLAVDGRSTNADAQRAAAVVCDGGAACVMLFGSVARGEQTADCAIVAVFDDLGDYEERLSIEGDLTSMAIDAPNAPTGSTNCSPSSNSTLDPKSRTPSTPWNSSS